MRETQGRLGSVLSSNFDSERTCNSVFGGSKALRTCMFLERVSPALHWISVRFLRCVLYIPLERTTSNQHWDNAKKRTSRTSFPREKRSTTHTSTLPPHAQTNTTKEKRYMLISLPQRRILRILDPPSAQRQTLQLHRLRLNEAPKRHHT